MGYFLNANPRAAYLGVDTAALQERQSTAIGGALDLFKRLKSKTSPDRQIFGGYKGIVSEQRNVLQQLLSQIDQLGGAERNRINTNYDAARGTELARLESRGLGASNLGAGAVGAVEGQRQQSLLDLFDQLLGKKIDTTQTGYQNIFGTEERGVMFQEQQRRDNQSLFAQLLGPLARLQSSRIF